MPSLCGHGRNLCLGNCSKAKSLCVTASCCSFCNDELCFGARRLRGSPSCVRGEAKGFQTLSDAEKKQMFASNSNQSSLSHVSSPSQVGQGAPQASQAARVTAFFDSSVADSPPQCPKCVAVESALHVVHPPLSCSHAKVALKPNEGGGLALHAMAGSLQLVA